MEKIDQSFAARKNGNVVPREEMVSLSKDVVICDKHGELTPGSFFYLGFVGKDGEESHYYCIRCIAELFDDLMDRGELPKVVVERREITEVKTAN